MSERRDRVLARDVCVRTWIAEEASVGTKTYKAGTALKIWGRSPDGDKVLVRFTNMPVTDEAQWILATDLIEEVY